MGPQVQRHLEETLEAAMADPESAAMLKSGTLSSPLSFIGFGEESDDRAAPGEVQEHVVARGE